MKANTLLKIYIYTLSGGALVSSLYFFSQESIDLKGAIPLILLTVASEYFKVNIFIRNTKENVSISWSLVLSLGALISLGVPEAILVNIASGLLTSLYPKRLPLKKLIYNVSANAFTVAIAGCVFRSLKQYFLETNKQTVVAIVVYVFISLFYVLINYSLTLLLMKLVTSKPYMSIIIDIIAPYVPHSILLAFIGALLGALYDHFGIKSLIFILLLITLIVCSLRSTAKSALAVIRELEESNEKNEQLAVKLDQTISELIQTLTATIDARDPYMYGHSMQVSNYALALASELKLEDREINKIRIAGLLHDIGKISVPENILFKSGKLTVDEYDIIKKHACISEEIVGQIASLSEIARLVGMHHERYDGKGYPRGLGKDEIPIGGCILAVADTLDTILSHRSYQRGRTVEEAISEMLRCKGTQFHPDVIDALLSLRESLGDAVFENSALLIDHAKIVGKVKTRTRMLDLTEGG